MFKICYGLELELFSSMTCCGAKAKDYKIACNKLSPLQYKQCGVLKQYQVTGEIGLLNTNAMLILVRSHAE